MLRTAVVLALATLGCAGSRAAQSAPAPAAAAAAHDALTVRELNVVDDAGRVRLRIAAPLPNPKGLTRKVKPIGIQLLDAEGREVGGLVMIDELGVRGLCFDSLQGYEAMCMGLVQESPGVTFRYDWKDRISLGVENGVARVVLADAAGEPRLRLEVDADGTARIVERDGGKRPALTPSP